MEICGKPNLSFFRPVLICGRARSGKTTLLKNLLAHLDGTKVVFGMEKEIDGADFNSKFLRRDVLSRKYDVVVVEDLPRLLGVKRYERTLMELLTLSAHLKSNVIVTSQTDEGLPKRFLKQFKAVAFFNCVLDYKRWWQLLGSKETNHLQKVVNELEPFEYVLLDLESKTFFNSFRNNQVEKLRQSLQKRLEGEKITEAAEREKRDEKSENRKGIYLLPPPSKRSQAFKMFDEGKSCAEVVKALKLKYEVAKQYRHEWLWKRKLQFDAVDGKTFLLTVRTAESWLNSWR